MAVPLLSGGYGLIYAKHGTIAEQDLKVSHPEKHVLHVGVVTLRCSPC